MNVVSVAASNPACVDVRCSTHGTILSVVYQY